ncbi:MAG: 30S ribosomal protein S8 [Spirochaetes bacterium]|nr:30S ribosomal protein S8 [Spirochaetota bacterium]MBN2769136.1 30S ribosomal protein S8 [Spirochaetota bacterium]
MSSISDPIADMLTRIRNAVMANKSKVVVPHSNMKESIARILKDEGFIRNYKIIEDSVQNTISIQLKYTDSGESVIQHLKRKSSPGRRVYIKTEDLKPVLNNVGIWILSTSKGVITNKSAKVQNIGGELLCEIA